MGAAVWIESGVRRGIGLLAAGMLALPACAPEASRAHPDFDAGSIDVPADERPALCARDRADAVRDVFCAAEPPRVGSLAELLQLLHLAPGPLDRSDLDRFAMYDSEPIFALLGHSTALSGHLVSTLNPRIIILGESALAAFQRGVQKAEVIAVARDTGHLHFYLFQFEQACNRSAAGCSPGDLFTPRIERDWLSLTIQDDDDLENTPNDCRQCHQRARTEPKLLMRELNNPWTHFFQPPPLPDQALSVEVQGSDLLHDYVEAKGDELYAGYAVRTVSVVSPAILENLVGPDQPVFFDAPHIEDERWPVGYAAQAPAASPTWRAGYDAFKRGDQLALPYFAPRVTDPDKHARLRDAYASYRNGQLSESELPDLGDVFSDDPQVRAELGLQTEADATPEQTLIQACGSCHNDVLNQQISRARFNVDLWKLDATEIQRALERLERATGELGVMPPPEARQIPAEARRRLLDYLKSDPRSNAPIGSLQHAAAMGMSGGARIRPPDSIF
jgi:cytochrome c553